MGGPIPTESNISMVGVGLIGRTTSGAGKSSRLNAASVRSFCSVYSTSEVDTLLAAKANSSHTHAQSDVTGLVSALAAKADLVGGLVPSSQLPSYVDDVIEAANLAAFPGTGESGKIYVALDTGKTYRWSGSAYVELTDATAVWGSIAGTLSNQTDLQSALTARALTTTTISAGTGLSGGGDLSANRSLAVVYGTTAGTACEGNDSRLSDARTPTSHTHTTADITGFAEAVDDEVASLLVAGSNITLTYDDVANTLTIASSGGGGGGGITSLNGLTGATQTFAVGTSGTDFAISSSGTTHTFNIPDASSSNRGLVTTGTQTFAGVKTFASNVAISGSDLTFASTFSIFSSTTEVIGYRSGGAYGLCMGSGIQFGWASGTNVNSAAIDVALQRDEAAVLGLRNGTNAQTFNVYGTYTSATSLERLCIKSTASQVEIGQQRGSAGGSDRPIVLGHYGSGSTITAAITIATNGVVTLSQTPSIPGYASNARAFAMGLIF